MLRSVIPIALTPFLEDGSVDYQSIAVLADFYRQSGAAAIVVLGIMGEAHALSDLERERVIEAYVKASGSLAVVATVSAPATEVAAERARRARQLGAQYVMAAPPPGVADLALLTRHFTMVAQAGLPWVLQDEPVTTQVRLSSQTISRLAERVPNLHAVKVEDVPTASKIDALRRSGFQPGLFGGLGGLYLFEELRHGARGTMNGFSYPEVLEGVVDTFHSVGEDAARALFYRYLPLIRYEAQLGVKGIAIRKSLFFRRGLIASPAVRAPATAADDVVTEDLLDLVQSLGLPLTAEKGAI